jgi:putative transposase
MFQIYHLWNRGVDGRRIFIDIRDRKRFLSALKKFNCPGPIRLDRLMDDDFDEVAPRQKLVAIFAYTLLDNHFHICAKEIVPGGMTKFLRKLGTGYTLYFNLRHKRRGRLFERRMQTKRITNDRYFQHLIAYIHLNVLDIISKEWRDGELKNEERINELLKYRWSSAKSFVGGYCRPDYRLHRIVISLPG